MTSLLVCIIMLYGFFLDKIGLLFIPTSGQTDHKTKQETFLKRSFDGAAVDEEPAKPRVSQQPRCEAHTEDPDAVKQPKANFDEPNEEPDGSGELCQTAPYPRAAPCQGTL